MSVRSLLLAALLAAPVASHATTVTRYDFTGAIQNFTVATTGIYSISALGGSGGNGLASGLASTNGGLATFINLTAQLNAGVSYTIVVGGAGIDAVMAGGGGGGGGGTFIFDSSNNLLVATGGGGGGGSLENSNGSNATLAGTANTGRSFTTTVYGIANGGNAGTLGTGGRGGASAMAPHQPLLAGGAGGGGFITYGGSGFLSLGGVSGIVGGVLGGIGKAGGGGGGGYSGGGGGGGSAAGGGGASFYAAATQLVSQGVASSSGNGYAEFTLDSIIEPLPDPASWMTMIAGFGLVGGMQRRRRRVAVA